jgi:microcystin-dependent protein
MCYGQAISRGLYAALFGAIGVAYGVGDGSTTFNLPDFRGRVGAGRDDMGGSAAGRLTNATLTPDGNTLGAVGGAQTHALTEAEGPAHNHGGATGSHNHGGATGSHNHGGATGSHNHGGATGSHDHGGVTGFHVHNTRYGTGDGGVAAPALRADAATTAQDGNNNAVTDDRAASIAADTASIAADTASIAADTASIAADTASIASSGSGTAHTNTQPTMIVNKMIKT